MDQEFESGKNQMNSYENRKGLIGYEQALSLAFENVRPMPEELCAIIDALGRVVSRDVKAVVNLPSRDSSLKDGYAVLSSDIQTAGPSNPVFLLSIRVNWSRLPEPVCWRLVEFLVCL